MVDSFFYTFYMFYTAEIASNQTGQLFWALPPVFGLFAFKLAVHVRAVEDSQCFHARYAFTL